MADQNFDFLKNSKTSKAPRSSNDKALTQSEKRTKLLKDTIDPHFGAIEAIKTKYGKLEIANNEQYAQMVEAVAELRTLKKALTIGAEPVYKPIFALYKKLLAYANFHTGQIDELIKALQRKLDIWVHIQEQEREKAEAKAKAEMEKLQKKLDQDAKKHGIAPVKVPDYTAPKQPLKVKTEAGSATVQKKWVYEITDPNKVPRKWLTVDHKAIKLAVEKGGIRKIAGVKIYQQTKARVTAR